MGGSQLCSEGDELDVEALGCKGQFRRGQDGVAGMGLFCWVATGLRSSRSKPRGQCGSRTPVHWQQHATRPVSAAPGESLAGDGTAGQQEATVCTDLPRLGVGVSLQSRGCHFSGGGTRGQHPRATPTSNPTTTATTRCCSPGSTRPPACECGWRWSQLVPFLVAPDLIMVMTHALASQRHLESLLLTVHRHSPTPTHASPRETRVGGEEGSACWAARC